MNNKLFDYILYKYIFYFTQRIQVIIYLIFIYLFI